TPGSRAANTSRLCSWSCRFGRRKGHKRHSGRRGAVVERMQSKKRGRCNSVPSKVGDDTMERAALWRYWRVVFLQVSCKSCRSYCLAVICYGRSGGEVSREREGAADYAEQTMSALS
ncbi:hypothetical protein BHM03_00056364, partial [Ensete ventricosum]